MKVRQFFDSPAVFCKSLPLRFVNVWRPQLRPTRVASQTTTSPREIEAQALLKAARQLQEVQSNWNGPDSAMHNALLFNRRLWSIFMSAVEATENSQPIEVRQNIANIGVFVMKQTVDMH